MELILSVDHPCPENLRVIVLGAIRWYLKREDLTKFKHQLFIECYPRVLPGSSRSSVGEIYIHSKESLMGFDVPKYFTVRLNIDRPKHLVIRTLFHELVHLKQSLRAELITYTSHPDKCRWMSEEIDTTKVPYMEQPWEVEAYAKMRILSQEWYAENKTTLGWKWHPLVQHMLLIYRTKILSNIFWMALSWLGFYLLWH